MFSFIFIILCAMIFVFDLKKRIIPNILLICILLLNIVGFIIEFDSVSLLDSVLGLVFALFLFLVPKFLRMGIGWGDVKYSAVLGFYLGLTDYIYGMLVAFIFVFIFFIIRKIIMKKDIKDFPLPLGSFMSAGVIFVYVSGLILQTLRL